ncbi:MAG: DoxX family protein [Alcanivorax sp.]|nr:DoxX family protein [Alcanivorax sp.]
MPPLPTLPASIAGSGADTARVAGHALGQKHRGVGRAYLGPPIKVTAAVAWFGNPDWGLGLPFPWLLALMATATELVGGVFLLIGFATRWISVPLMITMLVAIFTVHWDNGWFAIAPSDPTTSTARPLAELGLPAAQASLENSAQVGERLSKAKALLREHGHYDWLTDKGGYVVLNNGIEFGVTYLVMLLVLFFQGAGRYVSIDYWIARAAPRKAG